MPLKKSRQVFPTEFGTFTRIVIGSGPWGPLDDYVYALYFTAPDNLDPEEWKLLSTFNLCRMYPNEPLPTYAPNEYRRIFRGPLPTNLPGDNTTEKASLAYMARITNGIQLAHP